MENKISDYSFYEYLLNNDYYFDKEIIENYLLSLKVKPFAILTGNSGTGKTKLSQLFAKYIAEIEKNNIEKTQFLDSEDGYITVRAKTNMSSWKNLVGPYQEKIFIIYCLLKKLRENMILKLMELTQNALLNF